jgi:hypothetical protein
VIKQLNILIKFGEANISGFKGSLLIMQQFSASVWKEEGKRGFCQYTAPAMHSFSLQKLPLFSISSLIYDCRSYLTVACGLMVMCMQEKISRP